MKAAAAVALALTAAACAGPAFPRSIDYDGERLTRATSWARGGIAGAVYVRPGTKIPGAPLQVGTIISTEHKNGRDLHAWIAGQSARLAPTRVADFSEPENSCRIGTDVTEEMVRPYVTLQLCATGVERAVCVEQDEALGQESFATCAAGAMMCRELCDEHWRARRDAVEALLVQMMVVR